MHPLGKATRAGIGLVRDSGGMLSIDLSSVAGLVDYGPTKMAYDLARLKPELLFGTAAEVSTIGVPVEHLAQVPVIRLGSTGCGVFGRMIPAPAVQQVDGTGGGDSVAAAVFTTWLHGATPIEFAERAG